MERFDGGASSPEPLVVTGERTLPGIPEENYWFQRHVIAYGFAADRIVGKEVLDAGCGEGYGSAILAERAASVTGVDIEAPVIEHATAEYPTVRFERADLLELPWPEASFDAVVSLQVIEHLQRPREFVAECARVLRPGGILILSTPNRLTFSPDGIRNPFHTVEFAPDELRGLVATALDVQVVAGTFHGARLRAHELAMRTSLPERLIAVPVPEWPARLRRLVAGVRPDDFRIRDRGVERSLDLIVLAARGA